MNDAAAELWARMEDRFDLRRQMTVYELQAKALRCAAEAGMNLLHMPMRPEDEDLAVPLQVCGLEPDYLADHVSENRGNGNEVRHGIECDPVTDRAVAYWIQVPAGRVRERKLRRIPAEQMSALLRYDRWGQTIGAPWLSNVVQKLHDGDEYEDAEIVRARSHAADVYFVETPNPAQRVTVTAIRH